MPATDDSYYSHIHGIYYYYYYNKGLVTINFRWKFSCTQLYKLY